MDSSMRSEEQGWVSAGGVGDSIGCVEICCCVTVCPPAYWCNVQPVEGHGPAAAALFSAMVPLHMCCLDCVGNEVAPVPSDQHVVPASCSWVFQSTVWKLFVRERFW